jgi:D-alanyl-D-alanine endopeptidase (penicillin-binding protein 7)
MKSFLLTLLLINTAWAADASVFLYNLTKDRTEYSRNTEQVRAIASVTKIMTAMVALDRDPDLRSELKLSRRVSSNLPQQSYSRRDLLTAMLVRSDNAAAETLAENYPGGRTAFITEMNRHARDFDMPDTHFEDPTGLGRNNLSTVRDVTTMMAVASDYKFIRDTSTKKHAEFETQGRKKNKVISLPNTNQPLLMTFDSIVVSKTGLTNAAGWCVTMVIEQNFQKYVLVILGARTRDARIATAKNIMHDYVDQNLPRQVGSL